MYILGIDSSTKILSTAVSMDNKTICRIEDSRSERFMSNIISIIDRLLKKSRIELSAIDVFAVNIGPGDFTGTRIGIGILKTFAFIENKPIFGIDSLDVFAVQFFMHNFLKIETVLAKNSPALIVPLLDVKRNELFFSFYTVSYHAYSKEKTIELSANGKAYFLNKFTRNHLIDSESFISDFNKLLLSAELNLTDINKILIITGGTAFNFYKTLKQDIKRLGYNFIFSRKSAHPEAEFLNLCACSRVKKAVGDKSEGNYKAGISGDKLVKPFYIREFLI